MKICRWNDSQSKDFLKFGLLLTGVYLCLIITFYFLAGEQLHLRQSRGEVALPAAESGTVELCQGAVVEQRFSLKIQRLQSISVQWGTYYRANAGTIVMELWNEREGKLLLSQNYDAAVIPEGGVTTLNAEVPLEGLYQVPLLLRMYADSIPGSAVSPMMSFSAEQSGEAVLTLNGETAYGVLCFSAAGQDYIWTGLHYWEFAAIGLILLLGCLWMIWNRVRQGKRSYVMNAVAAVKRYRFLIRQLVARDFKTKYKRSVLGMFWSFLNPLLTMCVQYVVFSTIFKNSILYFPAYLLIGIVFFNFFSEACSMALSAVVNNAGLITKVYMPKYIYPLTRVLSSVVNLVISLIPLILVSLLTGVHFRKAAVLTAFFLACLIVFSLGLGLLLASSMVFFRDTQFLWGVLSMIWMYLTPIFYPESILPANLIPILHANPLYWFISCARMCILDGISPEPAVYVHCMGMAALMLIIGALVFRKSQDRFVLYL